MLFCYENALPSGSRILANNVPKKLFVSHSIWYKTLSLYQACITPKIHVSR